MEISEPGPAVSGVVVTTTSIGGICLLQVLHQLFGLRMFLDLVVGELVAVRQCLASGWWSLEPGAGHVSSAEASV